MRIAFVTGCLEPGRDGVGDYTRALAAECARRGHAVALLALADRANQSEAIPYPTWRHTRTNAGLEIGAAQAWLRTFAPDWASLQFVPYGFDPCGLFGRSVAPLARLLAGAPRRHVFFHELWIGSYRGAPWRERWTGWRQQRTVAKLLCAVAPTVVATSTAYYGAALDTLGSKAARWPVFGAVARVGSGPAEWAGVPERALVCGHFGTLHRCGELPGFLDDFAAFARRLGRPALFVAAGSLGYGESWFRRLEAEWRGRVEFVALGRLNAPELAAAFARFDFAVTSVPWNILGKSSSAAALREHGLRVLALEAGAPPRFAHGSLDDAGEDEGFVPYFRDHGWRAEWLEKTEPRRGVAAVAEKFLAALASTP